LIDTDPALNTYPVGGAASGVTLAGSSSRYHCEVVATAPPGLIASGISSGKPCADRSTIPPDAVHRNGDPLGGKFVVVDQPITRPRSSIPIASEEFVPGSVPRSTTW
jgi:hypothetical protein